MNQHYNRRYSKEEIGAILQIIQTCVCDGKYTIARNQNRQENLELIREYNLTTKKLQRILLQIETKDFCHSLQNIKVGYEHETLYVFCPQVTLSNFDNEERLVDIYLKFNIVNIGTESRVIVISFHERKRSIDYLFR